MFKNKIKIIGSCVTRDIFRALGQCDYVNEYSARSSLISRVSTPLKLDISPQLQSSKLCNFDLRMIEQDFKKIFYYLEDIEGFTIIIDLIDERFSLIKLQDSYITRSEQFVQSDVCPFIEEQFANKIEYIYRGTYKDYDLWLEACKKFSVILARLENKNNIIFHKVFQTKFYIKDSKIQEFKDQELARIELQNEHLAYYYSIFEEICQPKHIIQVPKEKVIADANHKWGLAPMHFTDEYYQQCYSQLISKINYTGTETLDLDLNLTYTKSYDLFFGKNHGELTDSPRWAIFPVENYHKYAIRGQIASNQYPIHNRALVQFKFLDKNKHDLKAPYQGISESATVGPYQYISINSNCFSTYVINFIVPPKASYVELGFRTWYASEPINILSKVVLYVVS
ncbi:DUF6270 domain-containing protein [Planktothrix sp.]|uniref:DUF6270 domain-containing protein n=1 Tax=Planktothrix sp. TaxID=3088171 RepID=UPI0038D4B33C